MGRELADIARVRMSVGRNWSDIVFVDDKPFLPIQGIPVIPPEQMRLDDQLCFAIGNPSVRRALGGRFANQPLASLYSPTASVSPYAQIGEGAVLCDYAVVNNGAKIGRHFLANTFAQISHDCVIGNYVTISPRVSCNGNVLIEDGVFIGAGAVIRNGTPERPLCIGESATVGMGAVVVRDVPAGATVMGVPAR